MLITSAVAMFFSCSGATGFSEIEFDSGNSVLCSRPVVRDRDSLPLSEKLFFATRDRLFRWTDQPGEGYASSSFLGTELSILTLLPERSVRKIL
jgi:hypothetical protein